MYELGRLAGLRLTTKPSALAGALALWALLAAAGAALGLPAGAAVAGGFVAMALHWLSELFHQLGHAWAARRTGFPMTGVCFWGVLSTSIYPRGEPELPANVHIRRALGGPAASLLLTLLAAALLPLFSPSGGATRLVALFFVLENLLVFTLQAVLPLGFNDGATLWYWWRRRAAAGQRRPN